MHARLAFFILYSLLLAATGYLVGRSDAATSVDILEEAPISVRGGNREGHSFGCTAGLLDPGHRPDPSAHPSGPRVRRRRAALADERAPRPHAEPGQALPAQA